MIDTHTHLNLSPLLDDVDGVWQRAQNAGIERAVVIGTDITTSKLAVSQAEHLSGVYAAVGIHPDIASPEHEITTQQIETWKKELRELLTNGKIVAIGECGLDYVSLHEQTASTATKLKNQQKMLFGMHIQLAKEYNLPLSIHCRNVKNASSIPSHGLNAYADLIDALEHFSKEDGILPQFVLHCMSGDAKHLEAGLSRGGYISFAGNVTYPSAQPLRNLLSNTPLDRLLLETDAPFLSPASSRGIANEPAKIHETYEFVARFLHMETQELERRVDMNAQRFFQFTNP